MRSIVDIIKSEADKHMIVDITGVELCRMLLDSKYKADYNVRFSSLELKVEPQCVIYFSSNILRLAKDLDLYLERLIFKCFSSSRGDLIVSIKDKACDYTIARIIFTLIEPEKNEPEQSEDLSNDIGTCEHCGETYEIEEYKYENYLLFCPNCGHPKDYDDVYKKYYAGCNEDG